MNVIPHGAKLLVKPTKAETVSKGGIILALNEDETKAEGEVVSVGAGVKITPGDKVLYGKYAGDEVVVNHVKHRIIREVEVLAVIRSERSDDIKDVPEERSDASKEVSSGEV